MRIVQQSLPAVVATLLQRHPMSSGKLTLAWHMAVGATMARASEVAFDESRRRLIVTVADGHWQREIERAAPTICGRLDGLLGPGTIAGLDVRVVAAARARNRGAGASDGRSAAASNSRSTGASAPPEVSKRHTRTRPGPAKLPPPRSRSAGASAPAKGT